mgnify:CR=1 FL=1
MNYKKIHFQNINQLIFDNYDLYINIFSYIYGPNYSSKYGIIESNPVYKHQDRPIIQSPV